MKKNSSIKMLAALARGILHEKELRRKMMTQLVIFLVLAVVVGNWIIGGWLEKHIVWFGLFWGGIFIYTVLLMLLCLYDMLMVKKDLRK